MKDFDCPSILGTFFQELGWSRAQENQPKTSQEFSEQFGPSTHKTKGFSKNSQQKAHPNFYKNSGRQILGNTFSSPSNKSFIRTKWKIIRCWGQGPSRILTNVPVASQTAGGDLSGTGDSQRDSRESIRANHSQLRPLFS